MLSLGSEVTMHIVREAQDFYMQNPHYILPRYSGDTPFYVHTHGCADTELKYSI